LPTSDRSGHQAPALAVAGLSARYQGPDVFRDLSMVVAHGEAVRVTGPNAAGKSTLLRCLAGIHPPRTGRIQICGADLAEQPMPAKRRLGYAAGEIPFTYLTGREHLRLALRVYRLDRRALPDLLDQFPSWAAVRAIDTEVRRYSHGMRQQLGVLLALLHDPCLLLLDEAADGFDDDSLASLASHLAERAAAGRSLVFVEHRDQIAAAFPAARSIALAPPTADLRGRTPASHPDPSDPAPRRSEHAEPPPARRPSGARDLARRDR